MSTAGKIVAGLGIAALVGWVGYAVYDALKPKGLQIQSVKVSTSSLTTGGIVDLTATALYSDGSTQDVTSEATWVSNNPGVAAIQNPGVVLGVSPGTVNIEAYYLGIAGSNTLSVT